MTYLIIKFTKKLTFNAWHYSLDLAKMEIFTKIHVAFHIDFLLNGHFDPDNPLVAREF